MERRHHLLHSEVKVSSRSFSIQLLGSSLSDDLTPKRVKSRDFCPRYYSYIPGFKTSICVQMLGFIVLFFSVFFYFFRFHNPFRFMVRFISILIIQSILKYHHQIHRLHHHPHLHHPCNSCEIKQNIHLFFLLYVSESSFYSMFSVYTFLKTFLSLFEDFKTIKVLCDTKMCGRIVDENGREGHMNERME